MEIKYFNALKYCLRVIGVMLIVGLIPAIFIGIIKFGAEVAYGHSASISLGPAVVLFCVVYVIFVIGVSTASIIVTRKKARKAGVSLDFLGGLSKEGRTKFEKAHGI